MNNGLLVVLYRSVYTVLLIVVSVTLTLYLFYSEELYDSYGINLLYKDKLTILVYIVALFVIVISIFFAISYENSLKREESSDEFEQLKKLKEEVEIYSLQIPYNISNSAFCVCVNHFCKKAWATGNKQDFRTYATLYSDLLSYAIRMKNKDVTVSWKEEMSYVNKIIELKKCCMKSSEINIDLFEISANYRFPIGLFIIPLFNAIESSVKTNNSFLQIDCLSSSGRWICKITNNILETEKLTYSGFSSLIRRIDGGNWPIKLNVQKLGKQIEVSIVGKHAG